MCICIYNHDYNVNVIAFFIYKIQCCMHGNTERYNTIFKYKKTLKSKLKNHDISIMDHVKILNVKLRVMSSY